MQVEDTQKTDTGGGEVPPAAESTNIRRRTAVKSEPAAVTTQEAIDESREKVMRIASVEKVELGNLMELSITGQVLRWARQSNLSGGLSSRKSDGWNLKNHSHLTVARHLREKTHPQHADCDDQRRRRSKIMQCSIERIVENRQGSN